MANIERRHSTPDNHHHKWVDAAKSLGLSPIQENWKSWILINIFRFDTYTLKGTNTRFYTRDLVNLGKNLANFNNPKLFTKAEFKAVCLLEVRAALDKLNVNAAPQAQPRSQEFDVDIQVEEDDKLQQDSFSEQDLESRPLLSPRTSINISKSSQDEDHSSAEEEVKRGNELQGNVPQKPSPRSPQGLDLDIVTPGHDGIQLQIDLPSEQDSERSPLLSPPIAIIISPLNHDEYNFIDEKDRAEEEDKARTELQVNVPQRKSPSPHQGLDFESVTEDIDNELVINDIDKALQLPSPEQNQRRTPSPVFPVIHAIDTSEDDIEDYAIKVRLGAESEKKSDAESKNEGKSQLTPIPRRVSEMLSFDAGNVQKPLVADPADDEPQSSNPMSPEGRGTPESSSSEDNAEVVQNLLQISEEEAVEKLEEEEEEESALIDITEEMQTILDKWQGLAEFTDNALEKIENDEVQVLKGKCDGLKDELVVDNQLDLDKLDEYMQTLQQLSELPAIRNEQVVVNAIFMEFCKLKEI